jgi:hypothetical protein
MLKSIFTSSFFFLLFTVSVFAQNTISGERYGKTLNLGLGIGGYSGYYGYIGRTLPVININYEIDVNKNFTLAPFISFYSFTNRYYWGDNNKNYPYRNYTYRETVIPIGLKGAYYFDDLLQAGSDWDFYLAGSVGFAIVNTRWDNDYYGDKDYYKRGNPLFLDLHIGTEYHFNSHIGAFLDLSTGVSTIGIAIH